MGKVGALVDAADRLHTVAPRTRHQLWVTEFAWLTNPPDVQLGDSGPTAARYVAYSMYEMWKSGVSLVIWQTVLDESNMVFAGGGLYTSSGQPKPTLQAFAFPFVASVGGGHAVVWGRAPVSRRVRVVMRRALGRGWRTVATMRTGSGGVFRGRFRARGHASYRAHIVGGSTSLAYAPVPIRPGRTHPYTIR